ncbi:MAG: transcription-repair coupling factor, partial [Lachnospiraceae bacterium]|nr:transcription-repair coupling factor [Lachnospiraceae bacterium]
GLSRNSMEISVGMTLEQERFIEKLAGMGYERTDEVDTIGQFSVRGGIVDIYDLTEENPYRIELWGDEVDSVRSFDVLSQRSVEKLESISIFPATEFVLSGERIQRGLERLEEEAKKQEKILRESFRTEEAYRVKMLVKEFAEKLELRGSVNLESYLSYFFEDTVTFPEMLERLCAAGEARKGSDIIYFMDEPLRIREQAIAVESEFRESMSQRAEKGYALPGQMNLLLGGEEAAARLAQGRVVLLSSMDLRGGYFTPQIKSDINVRNVAPYNGSFETLLKDLKNYKKRGYRVVLLSGSRTRAARLAQDLWEQELTAVYSENPMREVQPGEILTLYGHVEKGFEYPLLKFVVLSETDIFGAEKKKKKRRKLYRGQQIGSFDELKVGDYVVHESYGLGIYRGIEKIVSEGVGKDYIKIEYRDGGNLYIPATGLDVIQKYASSDGARVPKLNKLGGKEWSKTKEKVRGAVQEVAKDLVELYAARQQAEGFVYGKDTVWQREFEEMFPFEETEDQLAAIADTKADMESRRIMDRLICGDVGYGKTEIAIRAAFKAVQEGKQVAYLVPTTILAQQHYNTFSQRMKDFPVRIELMSRFRSPAQQKKTVTDLKKGLVDIVIGTHRILSKDVEFKDLGLLVIDEEQRFGVSHKEKIKKMKENVDVLTLTATPIPRTLHMSLVGIRDMSVLEEAPEDRLPIQTYVCEYNDEMVREAISRELARGGQVYYVYNRVNHIADVAAKIQQMLPDINVAFAHGQMKETELEKIMYDFIDGQIDVLVSTTIIETGLDISNVNTMIIQEPERLGLSQLYQLRGRVGRSNRTAYAFLMYKRDKMLSEVAEKRLAAIREFTELGSGFKIAMRDLEIRGAGNLLGTTQHGHMEAVGYELYCKMLNDAVRKLKGSTPESRQQEDFLTQVDLEVDAFIPPEYIVNEEQKLDIYKRIASIENEKEMDDMKDELLDRFGDIPGSADNLLRIALIRAAAHKLDLTEVKGHPGQVVFTFRPDAGINPAGIPTLIAYFGGQMTFAAGGIPCLTLRYDRSGLVETDEVQLLQKTEEVLTEMKEVLL